MIFLTKLDGTQLVVNDDQILWLERTPDTVIHLATGARLMVSGDTGPLQIAAAVGTPIVALFGPTFPERNGPWSAADVTLSRADGCSCHYERRCRRREPCIDEIAADQVVAAVERRIVAHG